MYQSLDSSIQGALSALFPPFEATAPIVLSQLFRTIEERYHGDALQCLLDFLIPSKHLLESVQQAACAGYSDVVFRCEGWPLCLRDKTIIQLAPVNPLLLRPGDFYLQVEPFGDQAARVVLKSLLEEGRREVEETPVPEASYPCIFTEEWLRDVNEGRHGTPLSRCLLCTDQGVVKLPWVEIAIPEFLDKPKIMPTYREAPPEPKQIPVPSLFNSSTLPMEAILVPAKHRMPASLRPVHCSSKLVKMDHERRTSKSCSRSLIKPVGWVSPNTWDSHNYRGIEGDYVDLVDIATGKELVNKPRSSHPHPPNSVVFKPVRPPPPVPLGTSVPCGSTLRCAEEPCPPCSQSRLEHEPADPDLKCRYRDSYVAALRNPVAFERGSVDLMAALEEGGLCEEGELRVKVAFEAQRDKLGHFCKHCNKPVMRSELCQHRHCCEPESCASHLQDLPATSEPEHVMKESPVIFKSTPGLSQSHKVQMKLISHQSGPNAAVRPESDGDIKPPQKVEVVKPSGKHKVKGRSLSTVSETSKGSPLLYKVNTRSHSDICPETISSIIQCKKAELLDQVTLKLERLKSPKKGKRVKAECVPLSSFEPPCSLLLPHTHTHTHTVCDDLLLNLCLLPFKPSGSRDKTGRAVVEVHGGRKEWTSTLVSVQSVCKLLLYLHSIPRKEVRELGMTLVLNARRKPPSLHLYRALLMAQEQALHAVHSIVMLVDKDTCPRPEKQPGLQMDVVTSMKALNKTVEASQLTSDLGGTFTYSHTDWLQFHQRLLSFLAELRGADILLQKAIKKVDGSKATDSAQEVQQCIQEQKASMKEVLEDSRLVTLQREGGAALARMRREEFRFPLSEDYRDALESVTSLYNQVEEKLHTLVMRSNESLQHLDFLFKLREMEATISTWIRDLHLLIFFQDKHQRALSLVAEAKALVGTSDPSPATDVFRTLVSTFKSNMDDFMLRAEQQRKELETAVHMHRFSEQASALAKECSHFLEQVEPGCYPAQTLRTLQMYEERLGGEFSTLHFQALKAKACAGASGVMGVWNAARIQCQEVGQRLKEMQQKEKGVDKNQIHQITAANPQGEVGGMEKEEKRSEAGEDGCSLTQQKVRMIMEELLSTEREYVKALGYVREHYFSELERPDVPQDLRGQGGSVFGNLEKLHDFHRHHFLRELESCATEPFRVGRCFLRHRESFALYALYSKNKPQSDSLLMDQGQAFFKHKQLQLGDKMDLWSYLLKPVQRISKYSLLLQDVRRECGPAQTRETAEVKAALEVIHFQLHHGNNLLAMDAIHHCDVNLKEQGQLIRQDEFMVTFRKKKCLRHIFLFQELILFSKTRKTDVGNETYIYKQSFKTSDVGMTQNSGDSGLCFEIWFRKRKTQDTYTLQAGGREVKDSWTRDLERILWEQAVHNRDVRMQERVFMGIGNKPFMDIQPSDAAINDRAVSCAMMGRGEQSKSVKHVELYISIISHFLQSGDIFYSTPTGSEVRCVSRGHVRKLFANTVFKPIRPSRVNQSPLFVPVDSSESSGESVSGFSSSSHSYHSATGGEVEDASAVSASAVSASAVSASAVSASVITVKETAAALAGPPERTPPAVAPKPKTRPQDRARDPLRGEVQYSALFVG
uniref:Quattro n=1 Tax=Cyclopterus lumpus TaxID=8103 RepID=A0A8C2ZXN2_CYCLU